MFALCIIERLNGPGYQPPCPPTSWAGEWLNAPGGVKMGFNGQGTKPVAQQ